MRVLVGAFGTRGDVQPLLVVSQALKARGHDVVLAVPPEADSLARGMGLAPHLVGLNFEAVSKRIASGSMRDQLAVLSQLRGQVEVHFDALESLAHGVDLVLGASVFIAGTSLAERARVPYVYVALSPTMLDSPDSAGPLLPWQGLPRWLNRLGWWVTHRVWNVATLGPLNRARKKLGLAPVKNVWRQVLGEHPLLATDPTLGPVPSGHPVPVSQPGALLLEDAGALSAETEAFLAAGPPPVYVGFGSMSDPHPERTTRRIVEAVKRAGVRAVVSRGWAGLGVDDAPRDVLHFAGPEPHSKLFPRCAAVVHHGGAGTTHAAARAGVPQLVLPQVLDQFFWRRRTVELGVNPGHVPRYGSDPRGLAEALVRMTSDEALRSRATALGRELVRDGVSRAVAMIEAMH